MSYVNTMFLESVFVANKTSSLTLTLVRYSHTYQNENALDC